jgi:hypothetical protein
VQGHKRRYSLDDVKDVARRNGFFPKEATYWGGPLVPVAALRKATLTIGAKGPGDYATGFDPGSALMNACLYRCAQLEMIPQQIAGTSVMAVLDTVA